MSGVNPPPLVADTWCHTFAEGSYLRRNPFFLARAHLLMRLLVLLDDPFGFLGGRAPCGFGGGSLTTRAL